jgi:O-antigen/teichoic acid export membrane protein
MKKGDTPLRRESACKAVCVCKAAPRVNDLLDSRDAGSAAIRGGALRVAGYAVGVVLTVGSAAVLFRHLGVRDTGRFVLVLSLVTLAAGLTDAGLSTIGVRELSLRAAEERVRFLRHLLGLRVALTAAGIALACLYAVAAGYDGTIVAGTAIAGCGVLAANLQAALATALQADLRLGLVTAAELARQAATAIGIVVLALAGAGLLAFFANTVVAGVVALGLTAAFVRHARPSFDRAAWGALLRETLPFALAVAVGALYFRLAILLVDMLSDDRQTGFFGASFRVVEVLVVVPQLVVGAGFPIFARAARDDRERLAYGLQRMFEACLVLGVLIAVALGVGAPVAIDVIAGEDFDPAEGVLRIHAVALLGSFVAALFGYALLALRRHREVLAMSASALVAVAVAGAVLIPSHGAQGGAWATVAGELTLALVGWWLLARGPDGLALKVGKVPLALLCGAAGVLPAFVLPALPAALIGSLVTAGLLAVLRVIPAEVWAEVRRR